MTDRTILTDPTGKEWHIPTDRLTTAHKLSITTRCSYHLTHPITCVLSECLFDQFVPYHIPIGDYVWEDFNDGPQLLDWEVGCDV